MHCLGADPYKECVRIRDFPIVCSGTIAGTPEGLSALAKQVMAMRKELKMCGGGPLDQGLINILVGRLRLNERVPFLHGVPFAIQPDGHGGMVHTIQYAK